MSLIARKDAGTGIQRTVKGIWQALEQDPERDFQLVPVVGFRFGGYRRIRPDFLARPIGIVVVPHPGNRLRPRAGDVFFGLDFAPHVIARNSAQLDRWRRVGVTTAFIVYDVLPLRHPQWFTPVAVARYEQWFAQIARLADELLCISQAVRDDVRTYLKQQSSPAAAVPRLSAIALGGGIAQAGSTRELPGGFEDQLAWVSARPTVLIVGTIEPRKGHDQALAAFSLLWRKGVQPCPRLLIVGRSGWGTAALQDELRERSAAGEDLRWLSEVSDEMLERLYAACHGVLVPSRAEGFGLPLLEALCHAKPVLARDLPVFREFASPEVAFFASDRAADLAAAITRWLAEGQPTTKPAAYDWAVATGQVRAILQI